MGLTDRLLSLETVSTLEIIHYVLLCFVHDTIVNLQWFPVKSLEGSIQNTNLSFVAVNGSKTEQSYYKTCIHSYPSVRKRAQRTELDVVVLA